MSSLLFVIVMETLSKTSSASVEGNFISGFPVRLEMLAYLMYLILFIQTILWCSVCLTQITSRVCELYSYALKQFLD